MLFDILFEIICEEVLSNNNFPEDENINIKKFLNISKDINQVLLTRHCIKAKKSDTEFHGINYLSITKDKFFELVQVVCNQLLIEFPITTLSLISKKRFNILITIKSLKKSFLLGFETKNTIYKNLININLITIYEDNLEKYLKLSNVESHFTNDGELLTIIKLKPITILENNEIINLKHIFIE